MNATEHNEWIKRRRACENCGRRRTKEGHDPCIADLPGVLFACCGHGRHDGYVHFENGMTLRGRWDHVQEGGLDLHVIDLSPLHSER